jgi:RNA polymerase sigma-70 factor (ECF subfamily)
MQILKDLQGLEFDNAFSELVRRYSARIFIFLRSYLRDAGVAEDLTQEVFLRVFKNIQRYIPSARFSTWIYTIASNIAKDHIKAGVRAGHLSLDNVDPSEAVSEDPQGDETSDRVNEALKMLEPDDREILILRDLNELKYEEIALVKGIPIGTVKSKIARARLAFKSIWERLSI